MSLTLDKPVHGPMTMLHQDQLRYPSTDCHLTDMLIHQGWWTHALHNATSKIAYLGNATSMLFPAQGNTPRHPPSLFPSSGCLANSFLHAKHRLEPFLTSTICKCSSMAQAEHYCDLTVPVSGPRRGINRGTEPTRPSRCRQLQFNRRSARSCTRWPRPL